MITEIPNIAEV